MGLEVIPNQPINLAPYTTDECNEGDLKKYCTMYNIGDDIFLQWKMTPCEDDLNCDPYFEGGINFIDNGDFSTGLQGWNVDSSITWDNVNFKMQFGTAASSQYAWYYFSGVLQTGNSYVVTFTVSGRTAGSIKPNIRGTDGTSRVTNATFTETIIAGSGLEYLRFTATSNFDGKIDSITVSSPSSSCLTVGTNWALGENGLIHSTGSTDTSNVDIVVLESTGYIQIIVTVIGMTAGSLYVSINGTYDAAMPDGTTAINKNGTFYFYVNEGSNLTLYLFPSTDFDGTISELHVHELHQDYSLVVTDENGNFVYDATSGIFYTEDRAMMKVDSTAIGEGCFNFNVVDPCFDLLSGGSTHLENGGTFNTPAQWTLANNGCAFVMAAGKLSMVTVITAANNVGFCTQTFSPSPISGVYVFKTTIITGSWQSTVAGTSQIIVGVQDGGSITTEYARVQDPSPNTTYVIYIVSNIETIVDDGVYISLDATGDSTAGHINELLSVEIEYSSVSQVTSTYGYTSNCISIKDSHDCAKLVEGYNKKISDSMGFKFPDSQGLYFRLSQRLRTLKFNPFYPLDSDDNRYSDGTRSYNYAEREKFYEAKFDYMDETGHDALSAEVLMDYFEVDGVRYFVKPEDYKPVWGKDEGQNLAQARLEMRKHNATIYKNK